MARMIDADALQELCNKRIKDTWNSKTAPVSWAEAYADFKDDINSIPAFAQPGNPLTLEQLREMDGQPAWCEDVGRWAIVSVSDAGKWKGVPFALFVRDGARFEWDIEDHGLCMHPYPPAQQRWIPVSERLPEDEDDGETVLAIVSGKPHKNITLCHALMTAGYFPGEGWVVNEYPEWENPTITHWMPLPEPPEEGVNVNKENQYVELASHAIGLDHKKPYTRHGKKFYKPYRNYFSTAKGCSDYEYWDVMEASGYAKSRETERGGKFFWLTRSGLDWLGEQLGIHIYDEED